MAGSPPLSPQGFVQYIQPRRGIHIIRMLSIALALTLAYVVLDHASMPDAWRLPAQLQEPIVNNATAPFGSSQLPHTGSSETQAVTGSISPLVSPSSGVQTRPLVQSQKDAAFGAQAQRDAERKVQAKKDAARKAAEAERFKAEKIIQDEKDTTSLATGKQEPSKLAGEARPIYYNIHDGLQFNMDRGMRDILALLPDEIYTRDLLRPITGGGEQRLHEVGLRARLFKKYFAAWETLHVVSDGSDGSALVRDDVIQYLRDTVDLSGISSMSHADLIRSYEQYRSFLAQFAAVLFPWTAPYFADHMTLHAYAYNAGRGIVLSGGDSMAPYMITSIATFRELGCDLPIEVFYLGDDDLGDEFREELEALPGVTTRNLKQMVSDRGWDLAGWAGKPFAILMSSFREVLYVDADALFFRNPAALFDDPAYSETGALFFKDRLTSPGSKRRFLRQILPKPISAKARTSRFWTGESGEMQESGVMVIDKWRHFVSLLVITRMNGPDREDHDENKGVYSFFYGDKETFWLGFELAGDTEYSFHEGNAGALGTIKEVEKFIDEDRLASLLEADGLSVPSAHQTDTASESKLADHAQPDSIPEGMTHVGTNSAAEGESHEDHSSNLAISDDLGRQTNDIFPPSDETQREPIHNIFDEQPHDDMGDSSNKFPKNQDNQDNQVQQANLEDQDQQDQQDHQGHQNARRQLAPRPTETVSAENMTFNDFAELEGANFSMWSPQLLHLDLEGRPLWFNGWIQETKWEHNKKVPISKFEYYMVERRQPVVGDVSSRQSSQGAPAEWGIGPQNLCMLKSDRVYMLTQNEHDVLDMIIETAREKGAVA